MNPAHVHLLLNHIPVIGIFFGLLLLVVGMAKKSEDLKKMSFVIFVLVALIAIPTYLTGAPAEEIVEHLPGVSEEMIEEHEEAALTSLVAMEVLGVIALAGFFLFRRPRSAPRWFTTALFVLSIIVGGSMAWTANLGGQIRHTETRADFDDSAPTER
jgi:uncharacterized membrane protein